MENFPTWSGQAWTKTGHGEAGQLDGISNCPLVPEIGQRHEDAVDL